MTVELEDIIQEGPERRVDNHKLLIYLSQMSEQIKAFDKRLNAHMAAEEEHQGKIKELIDLLVGFKVFLRAAKYLGGGAAAVGGGLLWIKDHFWR